MLIVDNLMPLGIDILSDGSLIFTEGNSHTICQYQQGTGMLTLVGGAQGHQDGCTIHFNLPSAICHFKNAIFICEINNKTVRLLTSLRPYLNLMDVIWPMIVLFGVDDDRVPVLKNKLT